ncbi:MAG: MEDS domain-containing protein [Hymenobacteraceae bacterium]|nr:MEDS domain-containing protein [Hymenobacteraceae bacterium]
MQLYESEDALLSLLEDFVAGGVTAEDCVIIIATEEHLYALEQRLRNYGLDVNKLCATDQYIPLDAHKTLSKFMVQDRLDREQFLEAVNEMFDRVHATGRKMRAFGEMVAVLWQQGNRTGTMLLEQYWNELFEKEAFPLLCAYPYDLFPADANSALSAICQAHSKLVRHSEASRFDLAYLDVT